MRSIFLRKQLQHSQVLSLLCHYHACTPQKSAGKILSVSSTFGSRRRKERWPKWVEKKVRSQYEIHIFTQTIAALTSVVTPLPLLRLHTTKIFRENTIGIIHIRKQGWKQRRPKVDDKKVRSQYEIRIFTQLIAALTRVVTPRPLPRLHTTNICLENALGIINIRKQESEVAAAKIG